MALCRHHETTDNAQVEGHSAPVIARVAGYIKKPQRSGLWQCKKGDSLLLIDDEEYRIALQQAEADYQQAVADLETARASQVNASASIRVADANAQVALVRKQSAGGPSPRPEPFRRPGHYQPPAGRYQSRQPPPTTNNTRPLTEQHQRPFFHAGGRCESNAGGSAGSQPQGEPWSR